MTTELLKRLDDTIADARLNSGAITDYAPQIFVLLSDCRAALVAEGGKKREALDELPQEWWMALDEYGAAYSDYVARQIGRREFDEKRVRVERFILARLASSPVPVPADDGGKVGGTAE
jgi:hypothetical protein